MTEWHYGQPRRRRSRVLAPVDLETLEGAPLTVLAGECEIEERGTQVILLAATPTHRIAAQLTVDALTQCLKERRVGFLSWR